MPHRGRSSITAATAASVLASIGVAAAGAEPPSVSIPVLPSPISIDAAVASVPPGSVAIQVDSERLSGVMARATSGVILQGVPWGPGVTRDLLVRALAPSEGPIIEVVKESAPGVLAAARFEDDDAVTAFGRILVGTALGSPDSRVILSIGPAGLFGVLEDGADRWLISSGPPGADAIPLAFDPVLVPPSMLEAFEWTCDAHTLGAGGKPSMEGGLADAVSPCRQIRVACDSDFEYLSLFQGDAIAAANYALLLFASAGEMLESGPNVRTGLSYLRLWATSADPWDAATPYQQLVQFKNHWNAQMTGVPRDTAHFLSGRQLGGGSAWTASVCGAKPYSLSSNLNGFFPYPLQDHDPQNWDVLVVTHEIAHTLGALHTHQHGVDSPDDCGGGSCDGAWGGTIMSYCYLCPGGMANMVLSFAEVSVSDMLAHLESVSCDYADPSAIPVATADWFQVQTGATITLPVLENDQASNCGEVTLAGFAESTPLGGVISAGSSPGELIYKAPKKVVGADAFAYSISAGGDAVGLGQVVVLVVPVPADLDSDGRVNGADLGIVLGNWGSGNPLADIDQDGWVSASDLGEILAYWTN